MFSRHFSWQSKPLGQPWHSLALLMVSGLLLYGAVYFYIDSANFISKAVEVDGKVARLVKYSDGTFAPVFEYKNSAGHVMEFISSTRSKPAAYTVGEGVVILSIPNSVERIREKNFMALWFFPVLLFVLSLIFAIASAILWVFRKSFYRLAGYPELDGYDK